jgi:two-component system sensor histidine kinase QseC
MLLILSSVMVVWAVTLVSSYRQAKHEVGEWDNGRLEQAVGTLLVIDEHDLQTLSTVGFIGSDDDDSPRIHVNETSRQLQFEVRGADGHLIASTAGVPHASGADALDRTSKSGPYVLNIGDGHWNAYTLHSSATGRSARVFERVGGRSDLTNVVSRRIARPLVLALPILAILIWVGVRRSFKPLELVSREIAARDADKLDPIDIRHIPDEVRALVDALNSLLIRLRHSFARERAFTSDAAHELKTPLAAIKVQAQVALATHDPAEQRLAMQRVVEGVDRSAHLAQQLLVLARLDEASLPALSPVLVNTIAQSCVETHQAAAAARGVTLRLRADLPVQVQADATLLEILIDNLIDNALKYGRRDGRVEVQVAQQARGAVLSIKDNGPGVSPEDRARLGDRFFRVVGNRETGSGLGLSIVARIAAVFDAHVSYSAGIAGEGLGVTIAFPVPN